MSPEQEEAVCEALVNLGWLENDHALHAEAVRVIRDVLACSVEEAKVVLRDLRTRQVIDVTVTPGGLDAGRPMPIANIRWIRPPARA